MTITNEKGFLNFGALRGVANIKKRRKQLMIDQSLNKNKNKKKGGDSN
tara:strand:- start:32 stop:175 length:144 start_codon:yes stop_codon:yes gene_type:complete